MTNVWPPLPPFVYARARCQTITIAGADVLARRRVRSPGARTLVDKGKPRVTWGRKATGLGFGF
jgi:hypothetical protein